MVECIIFDCDGTLVDSEYHCNLGLEMMLRPYKVKSSASALMAKYRGEKLANILHSIEEEHNIVLEEHFVAEYRALVNTLFEKELNPCDGVIEFLNQNTIRSCVASSGPTKKINKALEITDLKKYFGENIFSSYEINSWKPEPDIFFYAAKKMGIPPNRCLVVEDSMKGITAALAARMKTVLFDPTNLHQTVRDVSRIDSMRKLNTIIASYDTP